MSWYRDVYLKSDDWQTLRLQAIIEQAPDGKCRLCPNVAGHSLDVHHLDYKRIYDVEIDDLRVVCRECHNKIHVLYKKYPKLKKQDRLKQWEIICQRLLPGWFSGSRRNLSVEHSLEWFRVSTENSNKKGRQKWKPIAEKAIIAKVQKTREDREKRAALRLSEELLREADRKQEMDRVARTIKITPPDVSYFNTLCSIINRA